MVELLVRLRRGRGQSRRTPHLLSVLLSQQITVSSIKMKFIRRFNVTESRHCYVRSGEACLQFDNAQFTAITGRSIGTPARGHDMPSSICGQPVCCTSHEMPRGQDVLYVYPGYPGNHHDNHEANLAQPRSQCIVGTVVRTRIGHSTDIPNGFMKSASLPLAKQIGVFEIKFCI